MYWEKPMFGNLRRVLLLGAIASALSFNAFGEIVQIAIPGKTSLSFFGWPKVEPPKGWHQDKEQSFSYGINGLAPDGSTFVDAETVIYAKAMHKPRMPEIKTVSMLMEHDRKQFIAKDPTLSVAAGMPLRAADGKVFESVTFSPRDAGNWERVAYAEEGEFYLIFAISSRSQAGYQKSMPAYESLIGSYREKPATTDVPKAQ